MAILLTAEGCVSEFSAGTRLVLQLAPYLCCKVRFKQTTRHTAGLKSHNAMVRYFGLVINQIVQFIAPVCYILRLVEMRGLEPLTSALQRQRSPN